jgi:hypothetical protein
LPKRFILNNPVLDDLKYTIFQVAATLLLNAAILLIMTGPVQRNFLLTILVASVTACASSGPNEHPREPSAAEVAEVIGCNSDEVALCIETNCELEEWHCAPRNDVRDMFKAGDFDR